MNVDSLLAVLVALGMALVVGVGFALARWGVSRATRSFVQPPTLVRGRFVVYAIDGKNATIFGSSIRGVIRSRVGMLAPPGVKTGDDVFDTDLIVDGSPADILALLDEGLRARLRRLALDAPFSLIDGHAMIAASRAGDIVGSVSNLLVLLEDLERAQAESPVRRLFLRATADGVPHVRRRALQELLRAFPDSAEAAEARRLAAQDADPDVRRVVLGEQDGAVSMHEGVERGRLSNAPASGALSKPRPT